MKKQFLIGVKRLTINILATTALSALLMCLIGLIKGFTLWGIAVLFEILLVNLLAHIGFLLIKIIEFKNPIFNYALALAYLIGIIVGFGYLFHWFVVNEIWLVCLVGVIVFIAAIGFDIWKINRDATEINNKLQRLRERNAQRADENEDNTEN